VERNAHKVIWKPSKYKLASIWVNKGRLQENNIKW